ncbi:hypothetical protein BHU16_05720 [Tannerella sp. oral taxon 808]|nr:hypothetical protein BHU16_05720 [Tannerella sp. oral taxon 808]
MKKIAINTALFAALMLLFNACSGSWLDLDPSDSIDSGTAISDIGKLKAARIGMYDGLQGDHTYTQYYTARMIYYGDVRGDDMQARESGKRTASLYEMTYVVGNAPDIWFTPYRLLRRANNIIAAVETGEVKVKDDDEKAEMSQIYSEALVVRALVHFDLARVYGYPYTMDGGASLGVPIVLKPLATNELPKRSTVKEVYAQVIKDLQKAINDGKLGKEKNNGYITHWTAKALLARVYLYMGDNANAKKEAVEVIEKSPYELWTNAEYANRVWDKTVGAHEKEMILELLNASSDDWTDREGIAYLYNEFGYDDAIATKSFCELLQADTNDVRLTAMLASRSKKLKELYGTDKVWINKFPANNQGEMRLNSVPLLRLSEMYLIAAEAAAKLNDHATAAKYLNAIVLRANPKATPVADADATVDRILLERRKELVGEGHRFFDAMRNNQTIVRYTDEAEKGYHYTLTTAESRKFDRTYFRIVLPIPQDEVDANANMKQNPGY